MGYGATPVAAASRAQQHTHRRAAAAAAALLACACVATFLSGTDLGLSATSHRASHHQQHKAAQALHKWSDELAEFAQSKLNLAKMTAKLSDGEDMDLSGVEKTDQNTCLNKKYAELLDDHIHEQERNKGVIGDDFKEEKTGKDDYANARNKVSLKDESYKPVAAADAKAKVLAGFMNANEILEAWKWLAEQDSDATDKAELKTINLLGPSLATVESARKFVEQVKEDFPNLVHHCFITDCPPGKGLEETSGGPKCNHCETAKTWNGETNAEPCAEVLASCPAGRGYVASTARDADASCVACESGKFSASDSDKECADHETTGCGAGEELVEGTVATDGVCNNCGAGTFNPGSFNPDGTSFNAGPHSQCRAFSTPVCPAGTEAKEGNSYEDTYCDACEGGTFSLGGGAACGPHGSTNCGAGFFHVPGTRSSTHSCRACPSGQFKAGTSSSQHCRSFGTTTCPASKQLTAGSPTADRTCSNCPAGKVKDSAGPGPCIVRPCPACSWERDSFRGAPIYTGCGFAYTHYSACRRQCGRCRLQHFIGAEGDGATTCGVCSMERGDTIFTGCGYVYQTEINRNQQCGRGGTTRHIGD